MGDFLSGRKECSTNEEMMAANCLLRLICPALEVEFALTAKELAHLRHMNHGEEFMLFLKELVWRGMSKLQECPAALEDIFMEAAKRKLLDPTLFNEARH